MKNKLLLLFIAGLVFVSCTKQKPQLPSNKNYFRDTIQSAMIEVNSALIAREDSILNEMVSKNYPDFKKNKAGFWFKIEGKHSENVFKKDDVCKLNIKYYHLNKEFILEENKTIVIGRKETLNSIEEVLKSMSVNNMAELILPWYLAFGIKGNGKEILPYESLKADILIMNE